MTFVYIKTWSHKTRSRIDVDFSNKIHWNFSQENLFSAGNSGDWVPEKWQGIVCQNETWLVYFEHLSFAQVILTPRELWRWLSV